VNCGHMLSYPAVRKEKGNQPEDRRPQAKEEEDETGSKRKKHSLRPQSGRNRPATMGEKANRGGSANERRDQKKEKKRERPRRMTDGVNFAAAKRMYRKHLDAKKRPEHKHQKKKKKKTPQKKKKKKKKKEKKKKKAKVQTGHFHRESPPPAVSLRSNPINVKARAFTCIERSAKRVSAREENQQHGKRRGRIKETEKGPPKTVSSDRPQS